MENFSHGPICNKFPVMRNTGVSAVICMLLLFSAPVIARPISGPIDVPPPNDRPKAIKVKETGPKGATTYIYPTHKGEFIASSSNLGVVAIGPKQLNDPVPGSNTEGSATFVLSYQYNGKTVTDYKQQTGDPAVLQASAFEAGVMVNSLWDWLSPNGYTEDSPLFQPDFSLVGGGDLYFAVDLAALGAAGKAFVDTHALGSIFSINASLGLDEMPYYKFSSTSFDYTEGSGWTGGTPLGEGTRVMFDAFHETSTIAEPESCAMLLAGFGLLGFLARRRKQVAA